jgi:hypothetical protein
MRHAGELTFPIAALPLSVLLRAAGGRLVADPSSALHTPPSFPGAGVGTRNPAGVARLANGDEATTLGTEEEAEREIHDGSASSTRAAASLSFSTTPIGPRRTI